MAAQPQIQPEVQTLISDWIGRNTIGNWRSEDVTRILVKLAQKDKLKDTKPHLLCRRVR